MTAAPAPVASTPAMAGPQPPCDHASSWVTSPSTPRRKPQMAQHSNRAGLTVTPWGPDAISNGRPTSSFRRRLARSSENRAGSSWAGRLASVGKDDMATRRGHQGGDAPGRWRNEPNSCEVVLARSQRVLTAQTPGSASPRPRNAASTRRLRRPHSHARPR